MGKGPKKAAASLLKAFIAQHAATTSTHVAEEIDFAIRRLADRTNVSPDQALGHIRKIKVKYKSSPEEKKLAAEHTSKLEAALKKMIQNEKNAKKRERKEIQARVLKKLKKFKSEPTASTQYCPIAAQQRHEAFMQMLNYNQSLSNASTHVKSNTAGSFAESVVLEEFQKRLIELGKSTDGIECYRGNGVFDLVLFDGNKPPQQAVVVEVKFNTSAYGTRDVKYTNPGVAQVKQCTPEYYHEMIEVMAHSTDADVRKCAAQLKKLGTSKVVYVGLRVEGDPKTGIFNPAVQWEKQVPL